MRLLKPLQLRSLEGGRKVSWLELFFDLIFVAAVSQVAEPLRHHYSAGEIVRFAPLLVLIWWAWTGHTNFATRFDTDDAVQRALTLVQMFVVAVMAANAQDALDSRSSAGFAAAYAAMRFLLVAQYLRARHVPEARPLTARYVAGHGVAAVLWLVSALVPAPWRFWIWGAAFAIDLGTPWLALPHSVKAPPDAAHLPERFGLFTLILLGESVVAVMHGMESQEHWTPGAALAAFLGMAISFLIWWWYFDGVAGGSERVVRTEREALRLHVWTYAHFPLYLGIIVTSVGVQAIVTAAARNALAPSEIVILSGALASVMGALTMIGAASPAGSRYTATGMAKSLGLAMGTLALGITGGIASPVALIVVLALLCLAQVLVSVSAVVVPERRMASAPAAHP